MARKATGVVREGEIRIIPQSWENTFFAWMEDIRDWCISRQIWWGHRIPVWYCQEQKNDACKTKQGVNVARETPLVCAHCNSSVLKQDDDVLDTWFSSALWPFSTFGWPDDTDDLKAYYPTSVLITGFDIIFFWVARMIMMGMKFMKDVPFRDVYIHALVRDMYGMKMSKSKGNVIDPLIMMDRYGTDAFRFTLAAFAAQGRDIKFSEDRVEGYRHFVNKLWNAARFIMMNIQGMEEELATAMKHPVAPSGLASKWIMCRLAAVTGEMNTALEEYRFNDAASSIYQFIWHEFCDWYIEMAKCDLQNKEREKEVKWCLLAILETSLKLLHPFMPFITEEIWQKMPQMQDPDTDADSRKPSGGKRLNRTNELQKYESIMISEYPKSLPRDLKPEEDMAYLIDAVNGIRTIRGELNIAPSLKLKALIKTPNRRAATILKDTMRYLKTLAKAEDIIIGPDIAKPEGSATSVKSEMEIFVPLQAVLNITAELDRLKKDMAKLEESIAQLNKKLMNDDFLQRAPRTVVEKEKAKYEELLGMKDRLAESINTLKEAEVKNNVQEKK
jgi:valyl-tRNA synthetase